MPSRIQTIAELMLADNTHTSVILRSIGVQDGRPYDQKYAYPNRFTLVGCHGTPCICGHAQRWRPCRQLCVPQSKRVIV